MCPVKSVCPFLTLLGIFILAAGVKGATRRRQASSRLCDPFCASNYPLERVRAAVRADGNRYQDMFRVDPDDIQNGLRSRLGVQEVELCGTRSQIVFPQELKNEAGQTEVIVNDGGQFVQGIRVGLCIGSGEPCSLSEAFPNGYSTNCTQKYSYRVLLAVTDDEGIKPDEFPIPSCCSCSVTGPS